MAEQEKPIPKDLQEIHKQALLWAAGKREIYPGDSQRYILPLIMYAAYWREQMEQWQQRAERAEKIIDESRIDTKGFNAETIDFLHREALEVVQEFAEKGYAPAIQFLQNESASTPPRTEEKETI